MRTRTPALTATLLALPMLVGCGTSDAADSGEESASAVPAGVVEQYSTLEGEVAERGGSTTSGEWEVSYIVEAAEPWFHAEGDEQHFRAPAEGETHHIEIIPTEAATGRIVPDAPVTLEVLDEEGEVVDSGRLNFYYSTFFHYANNFSIPADGAYTLRATIEAPTFLRHGEEEETPALTEGATVTFEDVSLTRD